MDYKEDNLAIQNYNFSQDYELLYKLIHEGKSIIIVGNEPQENWECKKKLSIMYYEDGDILCPIFEWARNITLRLSTEPIDKKSEFIELCKQEEVSFLIP